MSSLHKHPSQRLFNRDQNKPMCMQKNPVDRAKMWQIYLSNSFFQFNFMPRWRQKIFLLWRFLLMLLEAKAQQNFFLHKKKKNSQLFAAFILINI